MFDFLDILWYTVWLDYGLIIRAVYLLTAPVFGLYLMSTEANVWKLGCVPVLNVIMKRMASGFNVILVILSIIINMAFLVFGEMLFISVLTLIFNAVINYLFAKGYSGCNAIVYGFVPFAKYAIMFKESQECKSYNKAKNTKKRNTTKNSSKMKPTKTQKRG